MAAISADAVAFSAKVEYCIQRGLVKHYLQQANIDAEVAVPVENIYQLLSQLRSLRPPPSLAEGLLDVDRFNILKLLRKATT
ncbi:MAG: hypothetical protein ACFB9N_00560 [Geitlerinemataceae cyanobacterium]